MSPSMPPIHVDTRWVIQLRNYMLTYLYLMRTKEKRRLIMMARAKMTKERENMAKEDKKKKV